MARMLSDHNPLGTTTRREPIAGGDDPSSPPGHDVRLVHITTIPESFGLLAGQVPYMRARGIVISGISSPGEALQAFAQREGVTAYGVSMARRITPIADAISTWRIYRVLRRVRPDIVHAQTPKGGLLGTIGAWLARVPIRIYHIRGLPLTTATGLRRVLLLVTERIACRLASHVLCVSHSLRDVVVNERLCPPGKIKVLRGGSGNGVDADRRFNPARVAPERDRAREKLGVPGDAVVAGFIGRIVRDKGLVELASAWSSLRDEFADLHLVIAGRFEAQDPIPPTVEAALKADSRVHIVPWWEDTSTLYSAMDLVVLPTYREGFPNVPLEAAAMALPIVATKVPGCVDAVQDGITGTLVPARDAPSLANAMRDYLRDPERCRAHGQAARERVLRDFRQADVWAALHAEYTRLIGGERSRRGRRAPHAERPREAPAATAMRAATATRADGPTRPATHA
jgi:glycosyltransferase involved in cell wall biosynthesis